MDSVFIALRVGITCIILAFVIFLPLKSRFRHDGLKTALFASLLIIVTVLITIFFLDSGKFYYEYNSLGILLWIACAVAVFHVTIRGSTLEILFTVLVILNLYVNVQTLANVIVRIIDSPDSSGMLYMVVSLAVLAINVPLLWLLFFHLYKKVVEFDIQLSFWKYLWLVPALIYLIYYIKIGSAYYGPNAAAGSTGDLIFLILWSMIVYLFFTVLLIMLTQAYAGITASQEARQIASILHMQEERYDQLLQNIENSSRLRHDWRHHLLTLNGFAETGDLDNLQNYLKKLIPEYTSGALMPFCQNHVIDVMTQYYAAIAEQAGILMQISLQIPNRLAVSDLDLCILFGNLLENAMDACKAQHGSDRHIDLRARTNDRQLVIILRNTYSNTIVEHNGAYQSTKHDGPGIGLASVRQVVKKYRGLMKIEPEDGYFTVSILLSLD